MIENRRGKTSHEHFPALIAGTPSFSEMQGDVWGAHLGWSGNHRLRAEAKTDGRRYLQAEALYLPGEMAIDEGETLWTPRLYASYSPRGLNGMSQQFHRYLRDNIIRFPENKPAPGASQYLGGDLLQPRPGLHHAHGGRGRRAGRGALYHR